MAEQLVINTHSFQTEDLKKLAADNEVRKQQKLKENPNARDILYLQSVERLEGISEVRGYDLN